MKEKILATALSATLLFVGALRTAKAETWVFEDTLRPKRHERSVAAKHANRCPFRSKTL